METCNCCEPEPTAGSKQIELELAGDELDTLLRSMHLYVTSRELQARIATASERWRYLREYGYL